MKNHPQLARFPSNKRVGLDLRDKESSVHSVKKWEDFGDGTEPFEEFILKKSMVKNNDASIDLTGESGEDNEFDSDPTLDALQVQLAIACAEADCTWKRDKHLGVLNKDLTVASTCLLSALENHAITKTLHLRAQSSLTRAKEIAASANETWQAAVDRRDRHATSITTAKKAAESTLEKMRTEWNNISTLTVSGIKATREQLKKLETEQTEVEKLETESTDLEAAIMETLGPKQEAEKTVQENGKLVQDSVEKGSTAWRTVETSKDSLEQLENTKFEIISGYKTATEKLKQALAIMAKSDAALFSFSATVLSAEATAENEETATTKVCDFAFLFYSCSVLFHT